MTTLIKPDMENHVHSPVELVNYLQSGARPPEQWGIGAEVEKLVVDAQTGEAAPFSRIEPLLHELAERAPWRPTREGEHVIALFGATSSITLEPGGQLELSGELCPDIHCSQANFGRHIQAIVEAATPRGLLFLGLGVQPFTPLERIDWLPKERYGVMGPYMLQTGDMGQRMMKQSAGLQVNLDYSDESDCMEKLRTAQALSPLLYALAANSPLMDGQPTGYLSTRGRIWAGTDPDRTGLLPFLHREEAGFADYVEYALDVPMYFVYRQGRLLNLTRNRLTFRRFMTEGFAGYWPTMGDWDLHLSTLFPEVRLRPQIEVRSADSLPPALTMGVAALLKGVLYDGDARRGVLELLAKGDHTERRRLYNQSWQLGLKTPCGAGTLREVALDVLELAREGLERQDCKRAERDESIYLDGLWEIAESGVTLAERLLSRWKGSREEKVAVLTEHCGFTAA